MNAQHDGDMGGVSLIVWMCLIQIIGMTSFMTFQTLLPVFLSEWSLTSSEAGWLNGVYFAGYVATAGIVMPMTDRMDSKPIYLTFAVVTTLSSVLFGLFADGVVSATLFRLLAGAGLAGTYMVGLKALTDRVPDDMQSRAVAWYTATFSIGSSVSYLAADWLEPLLGWQLAFVAMGGGSALSLLMAWILLKPKPVAVPGRLLQVPDYRPAIRNRAVMGYVLAYFFHNWELIAVRSWLVTYLAYTAARTGDTPLLAAATVAAITNMLGLPSSVIGNELSIRFGRRRVVTLLQWSSAIVAVTVAIAAEAPYLVVFALAFLHGITVTSDSASVTAGAVGAAPSELRGITMAAHSVIGFIGSILGPLVFGIMLDVGGGPESTTGWQLAFVSLGAAIAAGPICLRLLNRGGRGE